jgi:cellulose synthase (UDP-forming)
VQALFLIPALLGVLLNPRQPTFKVTPKGHTLDQDALSPLAAPFIVIITLNLLALLAALFAWFANPVMRDVIMVTAVWCIYNLYLSLVSLGAFWERKQVRAFHRIEVSGAVHVHFPRMKTSLDAEVRDISLTGIGMALKLPFPLAPLERVELEAHDSYGRAYRFEAQMRRAVARGDLHLCGAEFVTDLVSYNEVVAYVYGDSERWQRVWDAKTEAGGTARMLWHFLGLGVKGFRNAATIAYHAARDVALRLARGRIRLRPVNPPPTVP